MNFEMLCCQQLRTFFWQHNFQNRSGCDDFFTVEDANDAGDADAADVADGVPGRLNG